MLPARQRQTDLPGAVPEADLARNSSSTWHCAALALIVVLALLAESVRRQAGYGAGRGHKDEYAHDPQAVSVEPVVRHQNQEE
jgi:hypothetical protein